MLVIRNEQLEVFRHPAIADFRGRLVPHLARVLPAVHQGNVDHRDAGGRKADARRRRRLRPRKRRCSLRRDRLPVDAKVFGGTYSAAAFDIPYAHGVAAAQRLGQLQRHGQRWAGGKNVSLRRCFTAQCRAPRSDYVIDLRIRRFALSNRALDAVHLSVEQMPRCRAIARRPERGWRGCLELLEPDATVRLHSSPTRARN